MKRVINFNIMGSLQYHISTLHLNVNFITSKRFGFLLVAGDISLFTKVHKGLGALLAFCCPQKVNILCSYDNFNVKLVRKEKNLFSDIYFPYWIVTKLISIILRTDKINYNQNSFTTRINGRMLWTNYYSFICIICNT